MDRSPGTTLLWLALLGLCAVGLTIAAFYAFIVPEYRGMTFYSVMTSICIAEVVFFGYFAYMLTVPHTVKRPSPAARMQIMVLVVIWFLAILISGSIAVHPSQTGTFYSDKIVLFQAIFTFLLLLGAFFYHRQDVVIQQRDEVPQRERVHLQSYAMGVDGLLDSLRLLGERRPDSAVELDRLTKRLDTLKSQLMSVSAAAEGHADRLVQPISPQEIEQQLRQLHDGVGHLTKATGQEFGEQMLQVRRSVDSLIALLRRREDAITF